MRKFYQSHGGSAVNLITEFKEAILVLNLCQDLLAQRFPCSAQLHGQLFALNSPKHLTEQLLLNGTISFSHHDYLPLFDRNYYIK
ncbi:hypothetical protein D3C72_290070 [compost metagenome]